MKFSIEFSETYPHSIEKVWRALTDRSALSEWLMETDFAPEPARAFTMWCDDGAGGIDVYRCKLLEYERNRRMLWSWVLDGPHSEPPTMVEFLVEEVEGGTRVTVLHRGDRDEATIENFKSGWPSKLEQLGTVLAQRRSSGPT